LSATSAARHSDPDLSFSSLYTSINHTTDWTIIFSKYVRYLLWLKQWIFHRNAAKINWLTLYNIFQRCKNKLINTLQYLPLYNPSFRGATIWNYVNFLLHYKFFLSLC
jgi:hypothetical protein